MKIFIVAINIIALFFMILYLSVLVDQGWHSYRPIMSFIFLLFMGIHYLFWGTEKWRSISHILVSIFQITALCSVYMNIVDRDSLYAFFDWILTIILGSIIFVLNDFNDRLERLEN